MLNSPHAKNGWKPTAGVLTPREAFPVLPSADTIVAFETDTSGRPAGWRRVHAVDATVLPSIPATTITLTVMANAHRIGWDSGAASD